MYKNRLWIPPDAALREKIIRGHHDTPLAGHPGSSRTQELIERNYWWKELHQDMINYVSGCDKCQQNKTDWTKQANPLHPHAIPAGPWEEISWDIIGPLPKSKSHNGILVIINQFTKRLILEPINMKLTTDGALAILCDRVFREHGLPKKIISNRDRRFTSKLITAFYKPMGIQANPSTAYRPQTDGQSECVNQEIEAFLRHYINHRQDDWVTWLPAAEFAYNDKVNSLTGYSPFYLDTGRHPWKGEISKKSTDVPHVDKIIKDLKLARENARLSLEKAAEQMKAQYDQRKALAHEYKKGELVWLDAKNLKLPKGLTKKFVGKRVGPFPIETKVGEGEYRLTLPPQWEIQYIMYLGKISLNPTLRLRSLARNENHLPLQK